MTQILISLFVLISLSGCIAQIPFTVVKYDGTTGATSERSVAVIHNEIDVLQTYSSMWIPIGVSFILIPLSNTPTDQHQFNKKHQAEFADLLRSELDRLKVFRQITSAETVRAGDVVVNLQYKSILRGAHNSFAMTLRMTITGGKDKFEKDFFIVSDEGDSLGEKWTTNASDGKIKLVRRALNMLIPDIRTYAEK